MRKLRMRTTFILCLSMILFLITPTLFLIHYVIEKSMEQSTEAVKAATEMTGQRVEEQISSQLMLLNRMTVSLYDKTLLSIIKDSEYNYEKYREIERRGLLEHYLYNLASMSDYITGIYIISESNNLYYTSGYAITPEHQELQKQLWEEYGMTESDRQYVSPHVPWLAWGGGNERVLSLCSQLKDLRGNLLALAVIDISTEKFSELLSGPYGTVASDTFIFEKDGELIASMREADAAYTERELWELAGADEAAPQMKLGEEEAYITVVELPDVGWKVVNVLLEKTLREHMLPLIRLRRTAFVLALIMSVLLLCFIIRRMYRPLKKLTAAMAEIEGGRLPACVEWKGRDEYGYLVQAYNHMIEKLNELIEQKYEMEVKKIDAELNDLKGRINPHFIINTMQIISSAAVLNNDLEVEGLIGKFCGILRYSLYETEHLVPLYKEVDQVRKYASLREMGLGWKVRIVYDIPEELTDCTVMKMLLQPIVENCYFHAFGGREGEQIVIAARKEDAVLKLEISDNGAGITDEALCRLNERLLSPLEKTKQKREDTDGFGGIALDNISGRLRLLFGEKGSMSIRSRAGEGTRVTISLPYEVKNEKIQSTHCR